ncbi:Flp pilus assembly protein CpaB [Paeniglutamicibacter terrestris]|uniref:Flp pilus assembly protein CpaB n=1 Tax=Paeniglutamicibacter terrestris TaxID=2723403 RepID=A0ABX1G2S8_9MICC|nr:Flp pilus assembly protein CpaB [Paeniglutamicibacter terrestris]NKG20344.1 Flp pilus assembly protein CpaB [Paeniglutamicibacter terrestris]
MLLFRSTPKSPPHLRRPEPRRSAGELFAKYRRHLTAALAMVALALSLTVLAPATEEHVSVLVAARDLPVGSELHTEDLRTASIPRALIPSGGYGLGPPAAGSRLAIPVLAGSPVLQTMVIGPGLLAGLAPGSVAVPLRLDDEQTASLVRAGQRVDVVLTEGNGFETKLNSRVLARAVPILWTGAQLATDGQSPWGVSSSTAEGGLIVVGAGAEGAEELSTAAQRGRVSVVLVNPAVGD